jgi:hypothetical protein
MAALLTRFFGLFALLFALGAEPSRALAAEPPAAEARDGDSDGPTDMPRISGVHIPAVPAEMKHLDRGWLQIHYPAAYEAEVAELARLSEPYKLLLAKHFGQAILSHVEVRIAKDPAEMVRLAPREAPPPAYGVGVAYPRLKLVVLSVQDPRSYQAANLPEVYRHELAHVALDDATDGRFMPRWFAEGLAIYQAGEHGLDRQTLLYSAAARRSLIPFDALDESFGASSPNVSLAYAQSADLVRFMFQGSDQTRFASMIGRVRAGSRFESAVEDAYTTDIRKLDYQWRRDVSSRFDWGSWLTGAGTVAFIGLLVLAYVKKRKRSRGKLAQWAAEEELSDRMVESALARLQRHREARDTGTHAGVPPLDSPRSVVEHEGQVHTLH